MAVIGRVVCRAGRVGSDQDLDALDQLAGDLREREIDHRHMIGGGVRAGVSRPQQHRQRLPRFVRIGAQRIEPVPMLVVPRRLLLLGVGGD